jgi:nitrous oxidase accessory protein NosD
MTQPERLPVTLSFTKLTDAPKSYAGQSGKAVKVKTTEDGLEFGTAGVSKFTELSDVPSSYTGQTGKTVKVKTTEDGLEFTNFPAGGQTLYEAIVAPSGGDYTTLGAAIAAGKKRIFVRAGTYNESAITISSNDVVIVGESYRETILNFGSNILTLTGTNIRISGCKILFTSGKLFLNQATQACFDNNWIEGSPTTDLLIDMYLAHYSRFIGNTFKDTSTATVSKFNFNGQRLVIANNHFIGNPTGTYFIYVGTLSKFIGNHISRDTAGTGAILRIVGATSAIGNFIHGGGVATIGIDIRGNYNVVTGNFIYQCQGGGVKITSGEGNTITGNIIDYCATTGTYGIDTTGGIGTTVTGNVIMGVTDTGTGIYVNSSKTIVNGNRVRDCATGISVTSNSTSSIITSNVLTENTTALIDNGVTTVLANNVTA